MAMSYLIEKKTNFIPFLVDRKNKKFLERFDDKQKKQGQNFSLKHIRPSNSLTTLIWRL